MKGEREGEKGKGEYEEWRRQEGKIKEEEKRRGETMAGGELGGECEQD